MLANDKSVALKYTKTPYLICSSTQPKEDIYFVPDSALPALSVGNCDPMSLVTPTELFQLKKRYRAPESLLKKIRKCYQDNEDEFDIGTDISLEKSLFIKEIEDLILARIKQEYRNEAASFLPHYPREEMGVRTYHTQVVGSSSVGKSWTVSKILERSFKQAVIYVFSPTANKDKAWKDLRASLGKRVKLINSNEVDCDIPLSEIMPGSALVVDDIDSTKEPAKTFITRLQSRCLFEGRHHTDSEGIGMCVFSIVHDAFAIGNAGLKSANIESSRVICFPGLNRSICTKYWQKRLHWTSKEIKSALQFIKKNDRWACVYTHVPNCIVTAHGVKLL